VESEYVGSWFIYYIKASEFSKLKDNDQQNYWNWRHEHSDSLLKIEIK